MAQTKGGLNAKDLDEFLRTLPAKMRKRCLDRALLQGAKAMLPRVKDLAPKDTGGYAAGMEARKGRNGTRTNAAGIFAAKGDGRAHLLEYGHAIKNQHGTYGNVAADPHIRPAAEQMREHTIDVISLKLRQEMAQLIRDGKG